uniref:Uncharacterized protein n=1 Tax=Siphoviridae sp. ctvBz3 TaxID=2825720 RepID=A0A8S5TXJ0_9CAUD|nr:MAG TPA: hypothetical protein [Siphoviridae sp. ctvBz3]DAS82366.1 MAG TPA: hypothetical protein [Bacteriophage sp.]
MTVYLDRLHRSLSLCICPMMKWYIRYHIGIW